jgi:predicted acyltransferase (DUF342 family)
MKLGKASLPIIIILWLAFSINLTAGERVARYNPLETPAPTQVMAPASPQNVTAHQAGVWQELSGFVQTPAGFLALIIIFLMLLIIPFVPAVLEMFYPKDNEPLLIRQDYTRDPRYFDKNFVEELQLYLTDPDLHRGKPVKFNNMIPMKYYDKLSAQDAFHSKFLIIIEKNLLSGKNSKYQQPVYVKGKAELGAKADIDILVAGGDIVLGPETTVRKWAGTDHNITVGESSFLGKRVACDGTLRLAKGCLFNSLYALPIATYGADVSANLQAPFAVEIPLDQADNITHVSDFNWYVSRDYMTIPPYSIVNNSMIVKSDLVLRKGVVVNGDLKVYGKVLMEKDVRIYGELISDGDIEIGEDCYIRENLFSQSRIMIKQGVRIGLPGQFKSVVGKKGIRIEKNVIIYGYIMTAGIGVIL